MRIKEEEKMNRKQLLMTFATLTMLTTLLVPMFLMQITLAADPTDWYMKVEGVLDTDYYDLYPYREASIDFGLSKYGEMIDSETNVGLEYAGERDPFAAPAGAGLVSKLPKNVWINGWYIHITYNHQSWGRRNVWAGALFGDLTSYGGPWIRVDRTYFTPPQSTEVNEIFKNAGREVDENGDVIGASLIYGGRKTNGTATTGDIQVLYDGPRKFVAMVTNRIYDYHTASQTKLALVDLKLTFIFDKVDKQVVILKDVKLLDQPKFVMQSLTIEVPVPNDGESTESVTIPAGLLVQLSNREEWDLGSAPEYSSYAHYYTAYDGVELETAYNRSWTLLPTLPAGYMVDGTAMALHGSEPGAVGTYDMAQIISNDEDYVGFVAHWPSVSDWTVDAGDDDIWWRRMIAADDHDIDGATEPWLAPLTVGEWDFVLADTGGEGEDLGNGVNVADQFRGVSVYGVTDLNDGSDVTGVTTDTSAIDSEVMYQLDKHFNPWSLVDAVYKKTTSRWWKEFTGTSFNFVPEAVDVADEDWDAYGVFSERVTVKATGQLVPRSAYTFSTSGISGLSSGVTYIVRWSSDVWYEDYSLGGVEPTGYPDGGFGPGRYEWIIVGRDAATVDSAGAALVTASIKQKIMTIGLAGADMWDPEVANQMPYIMNQFGLGDNKEDYKDAIGRAALNDNWCTKWPVASSNMLGVGGPIANMLAYYSNDFTDAIYGIPEYAVGSPYSGKITGLACWQRYWEDISGSKWNVYSSEDTPTVGYAVISTYIDKNGTEVLVIWGHWGRDTYYATQWLHGDAARGINPGIIQLQQAPPGLTSIILKINYGTNPKHPTFSIPELLGTISETKWVHTYTNIYTGLEVTETKGGLHDP